MPEEDVLSTFRITNGGLSEAVKADHAAIVDGVMVLYRNGRVVAMVPQTTGCIVVEQDGTKEEVTRNSTS